VGGAPPLPLDFAPQGAKKGHFLPFFLVPEDPREGAKKRRKGGFWAPEGLCLGLRAVPWDPPRRGVPGGPPSPGAGGPDRARRLPGPLSRAPVIPPLGDRTARMRSVCGCNFDTLHPSQPS
jgi:hypothetical protein